MIKFISVLAVLIGGVFLILSTGIIDLLRTSIAPVVEEALNNEPAAAEETTNFVDVAVEEIEVFEEDIRQEVEEVAQPIVPSNPLITRVKRPSSVLSEIGVFTWTNTERALNGRVPLSRSELLDSVAEAKLNDMFTRQYFAHVSPTGDGVSDLAKSIGYEFLLIGENLALGDFKDDEVLLTAWMDSTGHRANILNDRYIEIGVAVGKGNFDGRDTWLAVQSFGVPLSVCDRADEELLADIDERINELDELKETLDDLQSEIQSASPKRGALYVNKVNDYNSLVGQYNSLLTQLNLLLADYNGQIDAFNSCVSAI